MPTRDTAPAPPNCRFQRVVGIIRKSACCQLCGARHKRHSFGSLLIQDGASLAYVKDQMVPSSIQITVDTYGHLSPGADIAWVENNSAPIRTKGSARADLDAFMRV